MEEHYLDYPGKYLKSMSLIIRSYSTLRDLLMIIRQVEKTKNVPVFLPRKNKRYQGPRSQMKLSKPAQFGFKE